MNHFEAIVAATDGMAVDKSLQSDFQEMSATEYKHRFFKRYSDCDNHTIELEVSYMVDNDSILIKFDFIDENDDSSVVMTKEFIYRDKLDKSTISKYISTALMMFDDLTF